MYAEKIIPLRRNGNLLLCTLLIGNVFVNAELSILMADMTSGIVGLVVSTAVIVVFGEIIPQAVCSRNALKIGAATVPVVTLIQMLVYVLAYPISKALDYLLGKELGTFYTKEELVKMMELHIKQGHLQKDEGDVIEGALKFKELKVSDIMTKVDDAFMLPEQSSLNMQTISQIFKYGFSRVPVYGEDKDHISGLLLSKDLIFVDPEDETHLKKFIQIFGRSIQYVYPDTTAGEALATFKQGKGHMAIVRDIFQQDDGKDPIYKTVGIVTLEDIIEKIIGDDIVDETDEFVDVDKKIRVVKNNFDMSRLRLLNAQLADDQLTFEEYKVISAHLKNNVPAFKNKFSDDVLIKMLEICPVLDIVKRGKLYGQPEKEDALYQAGEVANAFTLILKGKILVTVGKDGFRSEMGPWSVLGSDALLEKKDSYRPDYSAYIYTDHVKIINITRDNYELAKSATEPEQLTPHANRRSSFRQSFLGRSSILKEAIEELEDFKTDRGSKTSLDGVLNEPEAINVKIVDHEHDTENDKNTTV